MNEKEAFCNISLNSMLPLDMLAEVASETLRSDVTLSNSSDFGNQNSQNGVKSCTLKRSATSTDLLNLDQIRVLSDRMLLEMFSEPSSDEIKRIFSYRCYLMPDNCDEIFSSFGSEMKARLQMKSHLLSHVAKLLAEPNARGFRCDNEFTAEPLSVRKKRLQETSPKRKKKIKSLPKKSKNFSGKKSLDKKTTSSFARNEKSVEKKTNSVQKNSRTYSDRSVGANLFVTKTHLRLKKNSHTNNSTSKTDKKQNHKDPPASFADLYLAIQKVGNFSSDVQDDISRINNCVALRQETKTHTKCVKHQVKSQDASILPSISSQKDSDDLPEEPPIQSKPVKSKDVHQLDSLDLCHKIFFTDPGNYPQHDHTYTSVNGKTFVTESGDPGRNSHRPPKDKRKLLHKCTGVASQFIITTPPFPYVYEPLLPHISEVKEVGPTSRRSCDKCAVGSLTANCLVKKSTSTSSSCLNKQVRYRRINKLIIPEEMEPDTEDDENVPMSFLSNFVEDGLTEPEMAEDISSQQSAVPMLSDKNSSDNQTPNLGERKLALKCIRALRMKKKDERGPLVCQICNGKSFTAQATLMYHYRSHAGIKPFTCNVCEATFTRQHSLNYHMLIHNNKSRFVCDECGRSFRHPSHYKEHLRRHTGETPYQCTDCSLRFKTRNTYKRHLKTRHGKILTARGIRVLSVEEFDKVRTMPRRRTSKQSLLPTQVHEAQWSDLTFSRIPEVKSEILDS